MKTNFNFKDTKVGDKVYHIAMGWVTVNYNDGHGIEVNECKMYNMDGREDSKDENPTIYPYNPFEKNIERVVEVFDCGKWVKRVFITEKSGGVVCWNAAEDFENSKEVTRTTFWETWREIEPEKELTQEEKINLLWEKFGKDI
jgi:hypothetical protein